MKSFMASPATIERKWYVVDATGYTLGRLTSEVAKILRGKNKPIYTPHIDCGDYVIVTNASKIKVTGKKLDQKIYYSHSDYVGGMKETTLREMLEKKPEKVFVIHGEDSVCQVFKDRLRNEMHLDAGAPYSGTVFNLATGAYEKECEPVHVVKTEKSLNKAMKANTPFARLLAAGQRLLTVIRHNEGGANKDLARFTSQINSLCDKWDR